jgi:formate hydrogenlyase subunit 6/NADH:ubiquinone oxidoreductase subunit I
VIDMALGVIPQLIKNLFSRSMTVAFPHEAIPMPEGYRGEHVYDVDRCTSCTLCARVCPNRAVEMVQAPEAQREAYPKTYPQIDLGKCCFCGLCQDICPSGALVLSQACFLSTSDPATAMRRPFPSPEQGEPISTG